MMAPQKLHAHVPTCGHGCDLMWQNGLCGHNQVKDLGMRRSWVTHWALRPTTGVLIREMPREDSQGRARRGTATVKEAREADGYPVLEDAGRGLC